MRFKEAEVPCLGQRSGRLARQVLVAAFVAPGTDRLSDA